MKDWHWWRRRKAAKRQRLIDTIRHQLSLDSLQFGSCSGCGHLLSSRLAGVVRVEYKLRDSTGELSLSTGGWFATACWPGFDRAEQQREGEWTFWRGNERVEPTKPWEPPK